MPMLSRLKGHGLLVSCRLPISHYRWVRLHRSHAACPHETSFEHEAAQDDARCRPREVNMEARVSTSVSRVLRTPRINSIGSIPWTCIRIGIFPGCRVGAHHSLALSAWSLTNVRVTHTVRRPGTLKDYATPTISVTCTHRVLQRHHALSMLRLLD